MAKNIDVPAQVTALAQAIRAAADDEHERAALFDLAMAALNQEYTSAGRSSDEARAQLVLEKRAAAPGGLSVADQKNAAGALLKKRPEDVTAVEAMRAVLFRTP